MMTSFNAEASYCKRMMNFDKAVIKQPLINQTEQSKYYALGIFGYFGENSKFIILMSPYLSLYLHYNLKILSIYE
jgi:hypothetical protein